MSKLTKIFGPPGTGKTTQLLSIMESAMQQGVMPERIAFMAFTRKAADEAMKRAKQRFQLPDDRLPHFRTIHSMAFKNLFARRDDIMQTEHFQELGRTLGFKFTSLDEEMYMPLGTALGDKVARIEALSRLRHTRLDEQWHDSNLRDVPWLALLQWSMALVTYKDSRGMMDYTDLLEQYEGALDVDIFIIDEAQDLSPLQWSVMRKASATSKAIYVAGDDDQAIYGWAGANVNQFLKMRGDVRVLPQSFRLPSAVHSLAEEVAHRIQRRQPKQWRARDFAGSVDYTKSESSLPLHTGEWMLLSRNHRFLRRFEDVCKAAGFPYIKEGRHSTNQPDTHAIVNWERWRWGEKLDVKEVQALSLFLPLLEGWMPREDSYLKDSPALPLRSKAWMDVLKIEPARREYLRACLANRESLVAKPRIAISTVHRVKGGEAENVAFITDITMQPWQQRNTDDENRVLYVALTRAKQSLTLISPQTSLYYSI